MKIQVTSQYAFRGAGMYTPISLMLLRNLRKPAGRRAEDGVRKGSREREKKLKEWYRIYNIQQKQNKIQRWKQRTRGYKKHYNLRKQPSCTNWNYGFLTWNLWTCACGFSPHRFVIAISGRVCVRVCVGTCVLTCVHVCVRVNST